MSRMIKSFLFFLVLILALSGIVKDIMIDTPANCLKLLEAKQPQNGGTNNERTLTYKMYFWSLIPMGTMTYSTRLLDGDKTFSFAAASSGVFIESFVKATASVTSHFSKGENLPYKYVERTEVNGKIKEKEVLYDRANSVSIQGERRVKIIPGTYDPAGAFVHILTLTLEPGKDHETPFLSGHGLYVLKARLLNRSGGIDEILVNMRRQDLTSSHGGRLRVWVSSENNRIPLVFKSWTPVGYASVVLTGIKTER